MKTSISQLIPILLVLVLGVGCSGSDHEGAVGTDRMEQGTIHPGDEGTADAGNERATGNTGSTSDERANEGSADGAAERSTVDSDGTNGSSDAATERARAEREANSKELKGLRARLMNDLDEVRSRLNDGTRTPQERREDQARAASLAQGLARLDRALEAIDASTDATWAQIKQESEKEVEELRAWMEENEVGTSS